MNGIVLINKPSGITTYDIVRRAKKIFKTKRVGHIGTLDPLASGLVVICVGLATKLVTDLILLDKEYEGIMLFNKFYDSYDILGNLTNERNDFIDYDLLIETKENFIGKIKQKPPIYSALKVDGKKLYEYARENKDVKINERDVVIYSFDILRKINENEYKFKTHVSKGTYIRSLIVDIANEMGNISTLKSLKRTKIGNFNLKDAVSLNDLNESDLVSVEELYKDNKKIYLNEYMSKLVKNGIYLDERQIKTNEDFLVYDNNNKLIALYEVIGENKYKPLIIF